MGNGLPFGFIGEFAFEVLLPTTFLGIGVVYVAPIASINATTLVNNSIPLLLQGVLAHGSRNRDLVVAHLVLGTLLVAAFAGYSTAWWFVLQLQCNIAQRSFTGCESCPCAATGTCAAVDLASGACAQCFAPRADLCAGVHSTYNMYLLAFNGCTALFWALPTLCVDVQVLIAGSARRGSEASRLEALRVGVEQQTRLIAAGDKPTVTPGTLSDWVTALLGGGPRAKAAAEQCRVALRARGYELPIAGVRHDNKSASRASKLFRTMTRTFSGSEGAVDEEGGLAGAGRPGTGMSDPPKRLRNNQITPEETPESQITLEASASYV